MCWSVLHGFLWFTDSNPPAGLGASRIQIWKPDVEGDLCWNKDLDCCLLLFAYLLVVHRNT